MEYLQLPAASLWCPSDFPKETVTVAMVQGMGQFAPTESIDMGWSYESPEGDILFFLIGSALYILFDDDRYLGVEMAADSSDVFEGFTDLEYIGGFAVDATRGRMVVKRSSLEGIAKSLRAALTTNERYKPSEMAAAVDTVHAKGRKDEYDDFWDYFQSYGEPAHYYYKFSYGGWYDGNYNPKYDIVTKNNNTAAQCLFYSATYITDTKVSIEVLGPYATSIFNGATSLETIRKFVLHRNVRLNTAFSGCSALKNLTIEGEIGQDLNLQHSTLLTPESMKSVILHLVDATGTEHEYGKEVIFSDVAWERLEADSTAPNGDTWRNYVQYVLRWNI